MGARDAFGFRKRRQRFTAAHAFLHREHGGMRVQAAALRARRAGAARLPGVVGPARKRDGLRSLGVHHVRLDATAVAEDLPDTAGLEELMASRRGDAVKRQLEERLHQGDGKFHGYFSIHSLGLSLAASAWGSVSGGSHAKLRQR